MGWSGGDMRSLLRCCSAAACSRRRYGAHLSVMQHAGHGIIDGRGRWRRPLTRRDLMRPDISDPTFGWNFSEHGCAALLCRGSFVRPNRRRSSALEQRKFIFSSRAPFGARVGRRRLAPQYRPNGDCVTGRSVRVSSIRGDRQAMSKALAFCGHAPDPHENVSTKSPQAAGLHPCCPCPTARTMPALRWCGWTTARAIARALRWS